MYLKRGAYYFVTKANEWKPLGREYPEALRQYAALLAGNAPGHTVELLWAKYQVDVLIKLAKKTQQNRRNDMKWPLKVFGQTAPEIIEPHHIWTYWRDRGETEQARHEIKAISALLTYARQCGDRKSDNPCFDLRLPGAKARDLYVTDAMFYAVRDIAPTMIGYAMDLAWCGGLDEGTIRMLERRHVVATGLKFERGKTLKYQLIEGDDLVSIVRSALSERPQMRRSIICRNDGKAYAANGFQTAWQRVMRAAIKSGRLPAELRYHFHDIRAKGGSEAESDVDAMNLLGHSDVEVTRKHYRRLPQRSQAISILSKKPV